MGQSDIYELLKVKRLSNDWNYYNVEQIRKMLKDKGIDLTKNSINNSLLALRCFGFLDTKMCAGRKSNRAKFIYMAYRLKKDVND